MKAMILAAGFGKRLRPLTENRPKALMPVVNRSVIARNIDYLKVYGVREILVNAHHHHAMLTDYLDKGEQFGVNIEIRVEKEILGTGGGIRNSSDFWGNEPFVVINGDIITDIDLDEVYGFHKEAGGLATMVLHDYDPYNQILVGDSNRIMEISRQNGPDRLAFACIHIIEPELLSFIPSSGYSDIIDCYRALISSGRSITAFVSDKHYWRDIGSPGSYISANRELLQTRNELFAIGADSYLDPSARLEDWAVLGRGVILGKDSGIRRSILWDDVRVKDGVKIVDSVVTSSMVVEKDLHGEILSFNNG